MGEPSERTDLTERLRSHVTPPSLAALQACERICGRRQVSLFLVGGAVRDLLLGRSTIDLDLAVEAEVAPLARELAALTAGRAILHPRFGTASVRGAGFRLDLAQTRRETYGQPGALPRVEPAPIADDLARRDFTVNAIALRLTEPEGELIDPHRGQQDIRSRLIRVLHERSFEDDATRLLRAVRYAARLGFKAETETEALMRRDLPFLHTISGPRLRRELALLFEEASAAAAGLLAARMGVLAAIEPALRLDEAVAARWRRAIAGPHFGPVDELGFCVIADPADAVAVASLSRRLHLTGRLEKALADVVRLRRLSTELASARTAPAEADELLAGKAAAAVWALAVLEGGATAETCLAYLKEWRRLRPHLRGDDLLALGVAPGAAVGEALRRLRRARLEGRAATREAEVDLVRKGLP